MTNKPTIKPVQKHNQVKLNKTKIEKIQEMYGRDKGSTSLEDTSKYLRKVGFKSLGDLLLTSK